MVESQKCIDFIKRKENEPLFLGKITISYPRCDHLSKNKVYDIGYGTRFYPDGTSVKSVDPGIPEKQCTIYLKYYADKCCDKANAVITTELNQSQFDSLICFAYNEGAVPFATSTLLRTINNNPNDLINICLQFRRWKYAGGEINPGLINRRNEEFQMYISELDLTLPIYADYIEWVKGS
jgi:lysozyme